jgi:hypothetical protein
VWLDIGKSLLQKTMPISPTTHVELATDLLTFAPAPGWQIPGAPGTMPPASTGIAGAMPQHLADPAQSPGQFAKWLAENDDYTPYKQPIKLSAAITWVDSPTISSLDGITVNPNTLTIEIDNQPATTDQLVGRSLMNLILAFRETHR